MLELTILTGPRKGHTFGVEEDRPELIGRLAPKLCLYDAQISRRHAQISYEQNRWMICDLGSANGTFVNQQQIHQKTQLHRGDHIRMGQVTLEVGISEPQILSRLDEKAPSLPEPHLEAEVDHAPPEPTTEDIAPIIDTACLDRALKDSSAAQIESQVSMVLPDAPEQESHTRIEMTSQVDAHIPNSDLLEDQPQAEHQEQQEPTAALPPEVPPGVEPGVDPDVELLSLPIAIPPKRRHTMILSILGAVAILGLTAVVGLLVILQSNNSITGQASTPTPAPQDEAEAATTTKQTDSSQPTESASLPTTILQTHRQPAVSADRATTSSPAPAPALAQVVEVESPPTPQVAHRVDVVAHAKTDDQVTVKATPKITPETTPKITLETDIEALAQTLAQTLTQADAHADAQADAQTDIEDSAPVAFAQAPSLVGRGVLADRTTTSPPVDPAVLSQPAKHPITITPTNSQAPTPTPGASASPQPTITTTTINTKSMAARVGLSTTSLAREDATNQDTQLDTTPLHPRIAYLVDASGSLVDTFPQVIAYLQQNLDILNAKTQFTIIFFREGQLIEIPPVGLKTATYNHKRAVAQWLSPSAENIIPSGRPDLPNALALALTYHVDEVVILSDNSIARHLGSNYELILIDQVQALINQASTPPPRIHSVQFIYDDPEQTLKLIAQQFGGTFQFIQPLSDQQAEKDRFINNLPE